MLSRILFLCLPVSQLGFLIAAVFLTPHRNRARQVDATAIGRTKPRLSVGLVTLSLLLLIFKILNTDFTQPSIILIVVVAVVAAKRPQSNVHVGKRNTRAEVQVVGRLVEPTLIGADASERSQPAEEVLDDDAVLNCSGAKLTILRTPSGSKQNR